MGTRMHDVLVISVRFGVFILFEDSYSPDIPKTKSKKEPILKYAGKPYVIKLKAFALC